MLGTSRDVKDGVEVLIEGSLEVKLPTIWTDEKQRWSRRIEKRRAEERRSEKRKSQKKEGVGARKGRKVAKHCVFPIFWGSGGSKSRFAKAAGAEPSGQMRDDKLHAVAARSTFQSQNAQNTPGPDHFWQLRCRKSARRCGAKHISKSKCTKHTRLSDHFWKLRCRKSARSCGTKHISKSKCTKHTSAGPLLEVESTPLWRKAHFEVKILKTLGVRAIFGRSDVLSRGRRKGLWTLSKVSKTWGFCGIFNYNHHYTSLHFTLQLRLHLHYIPLHYTTLHYTPLHYSTLNYIQLHSITLNYTQLHLIALNYIQLHSITLNYTQLHSTTFNYTQLRSITLNYTQFHSITLNYTTLHSTTLHYTTLHYTTLHSTTLHYITLHNTPLHNTPLHYNYTTLHSTTLHHTPLHYTQFHYTTVHSTTLHYTTLNYTTLHYTTLHSTTQHYLLLFSCIFVFILVRQREIQRKGRGANENNKYLSHFSSLNFAAT